MELQVSSGFQLLGSDNYGGASYKVYEGKTNWARDGFEFAVLGYLALAIRLAICRLRVQ